MQIYGNEIQGVTYNGLEVSELWVDGSLVWPQSPTPPTPVPYDEQYLTFDILSSGTIVWQAESAENTKTISYSKNNGSTWTNITSSTSGETINVNAGDKVLFKGENPYYAGNAYRTNRFWGTAYFNIEGNLMSLVYGDNFSGQTSLTYSYTFFQLFQSANVVSAEHLILPATALRPYCYKNMFVSCTSLTTPPQLPATTLAQGCYDSMFFSCTSLTTAPVLSAETLAEACYRSMFCDCTSLTTAPELPAQWLYASCYKEMFKFCTHLTTPADMQVASHYSSHCCEAMFEGCTSLYTAPLVYDWYDVGAYSFFKMFYGCTSLTETPAVNMTAVNVSSCEQMFYGCTSLDRIGIQFNVDTMADSCFKEMFRGCTSLTDPMTELNATLANSCYQAMFMGCTSLTYAPDLLATTLVSNCYNTMFNGCTNLQFIKCLAEDISASNCTQSWVYNVYPTGDFFKAASMNDWTTGANGIPYDDWAVYDD